VMHLLTAATKDNDRTVRQSVSSEKDTFDDELGKTEMMVPGRRRRRENAMRAWAKIGSKPRSLTVSKRVGRAGLNSAALKVMNSAREKHPFVDKQSQIEERKTVGEQGSGDRGKETA